MNSPESKEVITKEKLWEVVQRYASAKVGIAQTKDTRYLSPELLASTDTSCDILMKEVIDQLPIPSEKS